MSCREGSQRKGTGLVSEVGMPGDEGMDFLSPEKLSEMTSGSKTGGCRHRPEEFTEECAVACLEPVLSVRVFLRLSQARGILWEHRPQTVRDVLAFVRAEKLNLIYGLGPRYITEIEFALVRAGFPVRPSYG